MPFFVIMGVKRYCPQNRFAKFLRPNKRRIVSGSPDSKLRPAAVHRINGNSTTWKVPRYE